MFLHLLELRTKQVLDMLRYASEGRCYLLESKGKGSKDSGNVIATRSDKKLLEKRKKALRSVAQILGRGIDGTESSDDTTSVKALEILFNPFKELFEDRTKMRHLWSLREKVCAESKEAFGDAILSSQQQFSWDRIMPSRH